MKTQSYASTAKVREGGCCCANTSTSSGEIQENSDSTGSDFPLQRLTVEGATCGACVRSIEQTLCTVEGVVDARMNLADGIVSVTCIVSSEDLINALERSGFSARVCD